MNSLDLARWQFGLTTLLHFAVVGVSIGLVFYVAVLQTRWHRSGDERWLRLTRWRTGTTQRCPSPCGSGEREGPVVRSTMGG